MKWLLLIILIPYICLLLRIYISLKKIKPHPSVKSPDIFVSVIVACRNEERDLPELLNHISNQDYDPDLFELIITDDNSNDQTFTVASAFRKIRNLRVIRNEGTGKKEAIRSGVKASKGNLLITTDADCQMGSGWIRTISSFYSKNRPDLIICPVSLESKRGFFNRFQEIEFFSLQGITAGTAAGGSPVMCNGANLAFTKESYIRHSDDLHDEMVSGDDVFLLHALKKEPENKIAWLESKDSVVTTKTSESLGSFLLQRARWISKSGAYRDSYTKVLALVTLITISLQWLLLIAGIFNPVFLPVFLASFTMKSVPDFLIVQNMVSRYGRKKLLGTFILAQLFYPLYVITVLFYYLISRKEYYSAHQE
ncbi:MAG: glycosyltransferase [Bacteroidales bacterium]|jgi:cellulose synthase/poly-beta-1,6-N-acetylglucosamine synthase-like glycosyltransferase|nr:glycosyltransferase [Bacteroidales bacterium]